MTTTHCPECGTVRVYVNAGAVCPHGCGRIALLGDVARELVSDGYDVLDDATLKRRCGKQLELMALPVASLVDRQRGHYDVDGVLYRKTQNRHGATAANYNGQRVWFRGIDEPEPMVIGVVEVQQEFI